MDPKQWKRLKRVFSVAVARGAEDARDGLPDSCHGDAALQKALGQLVEEHMWLEHARGATPSTRASDTFPRAFMGGRFRVLARVGAGTFGDVYRVVDQKAGTEFALKVLRSADPDALQHFKQEFRRLADVHHQNIVTLHELFADGDRWMFSMEFIEGVDFHRFLTSQPIADRDTALRSCVAQLAEGVAALHQQDLLHRDLKPANVLVTAAGRVKLLDFGLVRAFGQDVERSMTFAGTPDYMSPEQAAGEELRESSDWYGLGVMLYQALTGELPFRAGFLEVLRRKQVERAVPPIDRIPGTPADLSDLCVKLLERDPSQRASYADVIRTVCPTESLRVRESPSRVFVGRHELLDRLGEAYALAEDRPVLVHLSGPSGIGKTVLLREFLDRLGRDSSALIFEGRCYEGDTVPYQAVDDLIDHVAQYLRRLPRERVEQLLPRNFAVLVKVFPVLARVLSVPGRPVASLDSVELRSRAFVALREMFGRFAERRRVVLVIDDLQWGDEEGCAALNELVSSSDSPPMLVVAAYRSEDANAKCLRELRETAGTSLRRNTIFLGMEALSKTDAEELAASLLSHPANQDTLERVVDQSAMSPFLVHEIVRWINARGIDRALAEPFSLDDVIRARMGDLGDESRHFLELAAVAGQPTKASILQAAGRLTNVLADREELAAVRFIRSVTVDGEDVEVYHDRIRAAILANMDPDRLVLRHGELARALEADGAEDPERMAAHFEQAREPRACARYAWQAARRAVQVLAFNKASRFFTLALSMQVLEPGDRRAVQREFADALANAGRGPEAADHYMAACAGAVVDEQLELTQRAGEQLLYSGHVDRGLAMFETVLSQVGMKLPQPTSRMPLDLLIRRARLRIRGLRWHEREATTVPREMLLKVDTCASVATGLALIDIARGAALQTTSLILALQAGEPSRVARALAMEAGYRSTVGARAEARVRSLLSVARQLSERTGDSRAIGLTAVMTAACAWSAGRWESVTGWRVPPERRCAIVSSASPGNGTRRRFSRWMHCAGWADGRP